MKLFLKSLPAALLILLFVYAAVGKLVSFGEFRLQLGRQPFPPGVAAILLYILPLTELSAAALLLFRRTQLAGLQLSLSLLIVFTGYVALVMLHWWTRVPCSCGGILSHMSWKIHLVFNSVFIAINLIALYICFKERRPAV